MTPARVTFLCVLSGAVSVAALLAGLYAWLDKHLP